MKDARLEAIRNRVLACPTYAEGYAYASRELVALCETLIAERDEARKLACNLNEQADPNLCRALGSDDIIARWDSE